MICFRYCPACIKAGLYTNGNTFKSIQNGCCTMNIALPDPDKVPLKPAALAELAVKAKAAYDNMKETHDAYQRKADEIRAEVGARFNSEIFRSINPAERRRVAEQETAGRILEVRKNALAAVDAIGKKQIGPIMAAMIASKGFYKSPASTLSRMTLDSERRARIVSNLTTAGPVDLWHTAVSALQTSDADLAAAVIQVLNGLAVEQRPFHPAEFAARFAFPPHENAVKAINSINQDTQAAILLWRVVQQGKENPVGKVENALREPVLDEADGDAVDLPDPHRG
jgi:hypothetical protein